MPKQNAHVFHCQQAGDFTVVSTATSGANKENFAQSRNYQTLSQTIAAERLQLLRMVELENSIFTQAFHLIECFYRPSNDPPNSTDLCQNEGTKNCTVQSKKKRRAKNESSGDKSIPTDMPNHSQLPRKRIYGLGKNYKSEYQRLMSKPGISKQYGTFHHDLDWQLIFSIATECPTNLAKELNFDSLFDYEDAIATTANLLAISRQHSDLIDGLVLCADSEGKTASSEYVRDQANFGGSCEFRKMIALVEQLIKQKNDRLAQLQQKMSANADNSGYLLAGWFGKCDKSSLTAYEPLGRKQLANGHQRIKDIQREVTAWEELVDVVEISAK